jgi:hypothetical protein
LARAQIYLAANFLSDIDEFRRYGIMDVLAANAEGAGALREKTRVTARKSLHKGILSMP